jgi:hypothetical protein
MLNFTARRVALVGVAAVVAVSIVAVTSACGVRPTTKAAGPVAVATTTPEPSTTPEPNPAPPQVTSPPAEPRPDGSPGGVPWLDPAPMRQAVLGVEPNTTLGAVVFDRFTQHELLSLDADRQFRSASLVKLMIAIDELQRGADEAGRARVARMLSTSDDNIASALWVKNGPDIVPRMAAQLGLQSTEAPEVAGQWGEVKLTAHDMVRVYQYVMESLAPADHTLIVDALAQAPEYAADDFDQYFGIPDGLNTQRAIKQGWGNNSSAMVLHSTGLVGTDWRYIVILLTEHPLGSGWRTSANSVTAAASTLTGLLPGA